MPRFWNTPMLNAAAFMAAASCLSLPVALAVENVENPALEMPQEIEYLLEDYCWKCHEAGNEKGDIRLDNLNELSLNERMELFNRMHEQTYLEHMPPSDEDDQPKAEEREKLIAWISGDLKKHGAEKLSAKLKLPAYGNYVDHEKLFSGEFADLPGYTPDRRWLISEYIFDAKFNRLLDHNPTRDWDGKRVPVVGDNNRRGANLTNPFLLPTESGVRYYDNTTLDGGHLLTMLTNAREASSYMVDRAKTRNMYPSIRAILEQEWADEKLLNEREVFLTAFIDKIATEMYGEDNQSLLPDFTLSGLAEAGADKKSNAKKALLDHANPGREEMRIIYHSFLNYEGKVQDDQELIEACEREWANFGYPQPKIDGRIIFLNNYLDEWRDHIVKHRYAERQAPPEYKPRSDEEMELIRDTIRRVREKGDTYSSIISKCMAEWTQDLKQKRIEAGGPTDQQVADLVTDLFGEILEREPSKDEALQYFNLTRKYITQLGSDQAVKKFIETLILNTDFVYRDEFGEGEPDEHGRRMLSPHNAAFALAYALTDSSPDKELMQAVKKGRLQTREDYAREVKRMLARRDQHYVIDEAVDRSTHTASVTNLPIRELRFFREFFGYSKMLDIFKDDKRLGGIYDRAKYRVVSEADRLVEYILEKDQNVFEELLSTEEFYVFHSGDNEAMTEASKRIKKIYDYFKDKDWQNFTVEDLEKHKDFLAEVNMRGVNAKEGFKGSKGERSLGGLKRNMEGFSVRFETGKTHVAPYVAFSAHGHGDASTRTGRSMQGEEVAKFFGIDLADWEYPMVQPAKLPNRSGILTHPAWLTSFAQNTETDPIHRGKWVREKLLAGTIPDVPITVDAVVPEDHTKTMRQRLVNRTEEEYCWKCHVHMNPLGYTFEMYDDFGRFRTEEFLEHPDNLIEKRPDKGEVYIDLRNVYKTLPVDPSGNLVGTNDPKLDGEVSGAIELTKRLAKSDRVRQSIIRHAFRYFMGRNEVLSDSKTLMDADKAYLESGGSFDALIVSLLTSDSFIYRKSTTED